MEDKFNCKETKLPDAKIKDLQDFWKGEDNQKQLVSFLKEIQLVSIKNSSDRASKIDEWMRRGKEKLINAAEAYLAPIGRFSHQEITINNKEFPYHINLQGFFLIEPRKYNFNERYLAYVDFRYSKMYEIQFQQSFFDYSIFDYSEIQETHFDDSLLRETSFRCLKNAFKTTFKKCEIHLGHFDGANLQGADFSGSSLVNSFFITSSATNCKFNGTTLTNSSLYDSDFTDADFSNSTLKNVTWYEKLRIKFRYFFIPFFKYDKSPEINGVKIVGADFPNSRLFERYIKDEQFIQEFKENAKNSFLFCVIDKLWQVTSDYGRSLAQWAIISLLLAVFFALVYMDINCPDLSKCLDFVEDFLVYINPELCDSKLVETDNWLTSLYFSVVTFTTLGFGDVTPKNPAAHLWIMAEVIFGYLMLGGLISIFANKLARRAS